MNSAEEDAHDQSEEDHDMESESKLEPKKVSKRAPKIGKKKKADLKKEDKVKLAECIKQEDVIFNIQNKLHSNAAAVLAAWQRVATKMDKPGK